MKKVLSFFLSLGFCYICFAQQTKVESLDSFFGGVPLQKKFIDWFNYISDHPHLGIDSSNSKGIHSSYKPGFESHFPFPDSINVRILFKHIIGIDTAQKSHTDSVKTIYVQAVFGNTKNAKEDAVKCFKKIKKELEKYYRDKFAFNSDVGMWYSNSKEKDFPDCSVEMGFFKEKHYYYVLLSYDDGKFMF